MPMFSPTRACVTTGSATAVTSSVTSTIRFTVSSVLLVTTGLVPLLRLRVFDHHSVAAPVSNHGTGMSAGRPRSGHAITWLARNPPGLSLDTVAPFGKHGRETTDAAQWPSSEIAHRPSLEIASRRTAVGVLS